MTLLIRTARPDDYPAIKSIYNAQNEPDLHDTPEGMHAHDQSTASKDPAFRRLVADAGSELLATGYIRATWGGEKEPGRYWVGLHVRDDHRHENLDIRLLHHAIADATDPVQEVWTIIREDFVPAAGFLEPEGFEEKFRSWGAHLDLRTFDPTPFEPLTQDLEAAGIRLVAYHDLAGDPDRDGKLEALQRELEEDAVAFEPVIPRRHPLLTEPGAILEGAVVAVVPDGSFVGLVSLFGETVYADLDCDFFGVARGYRNRGIATALLARSAEVAQALGGHKLGTGGGGNDTPMMRVIRKLGFDIEPAWITFASSVSPDNSG